MRFTVRRMMAGVVVVAVALGIAVGLARKATGYRAMVVHHGARLAAWSSKYGEDADRAVGTVEARRAREHAWTCIEYHGAMRRKWEEAARSPWLPVEPDPSGPE